MTNHPRAPLFLSLFPLGMLAFGSVRAEAQAPVLVVDDDGGAGVDFTTIQAAIDAAAPGSTILVHDGTYSSIFIDGKSVNVIGDLGATVRISSTAVRVRNLGAAQSVLIRNIEVPGEHFGLCLEIINCDGPVWIEECTFLAIFPNPFGGIVGGQISGSDAVCLVRSVLAGSTGVGSGVSGGVGLQVDSSNVHLFECDLQGGPGGAGTNFITPFPGEPGDPGLAIDGGFVFASGTTFRGGDGGHGAVVDFFGNPACTDGGPGGAGLEITGGAAAVVLRDCTFVPGAGGPAGGASCSDGQNGQDTVAGNGTIQHVAGAHRSYEVSSPHRSGESVQTDMAGAPGDFVWVVLSGTFAPGYQPAFLGSLVPSGALFSFFASTIPPSGTKTILVPIQLSPQAQSLVVYEQALVYSLQDSAFYLGSPSAAVLLSQGF